MVHDLALGLGMTARELRERMTEREFYEWAKYAGQKGLPLYRLELMMARVCMYLDVGLLKKKRAKLSDYLLDPPESKQEAVDEMEDLFGEGTVIKRER